MKILGIDSSGTVASVALVCDDTLVGEFTINNKLTHSQTLLPMLDEMIKMAGVELGDIDAIAIAAGPGSFTGLRIGSSTAKGLGLALEKPIVPVPTLDGLAYRLAEAEGIICPLMDARRNQVYTAAYKMDQGRLTYVVEQQAMDIGEMIEKINTLGQKVHFLGDGVPVYKDIIIDQCKVPYDFAPAHFSKQSAASVAVLGEVYFKEGKIETAADHKPFYLRKSQAERERAEKLKENGNS